MGIFPLLNIPFNIIPGELLRDSFMIMLKIAYDGFRHPYTCSSYLEGVYLLFVQLAKVFLTSRFCCPHMSPFGV